MFDDFLDDPDDELIDVEEGADVPAAAGLNVSRENASLQGHESVEKNLIDILNSGSVPHAMMFAGPEGIGKSLMAYRLARHVLKKGVGDDGQDSLFGGGPEPVTSLQMDSADQIFRLVASGGHPDLMVIERPMDERKGEQKSSVDVDSARKVAPFLRMTASGANGWRVVIINDADTMNRNAQNAILKILEEPPPRALLILIVHRAGAMVPTIRSRCRLINFAPLPDDIVLDLMARHDPSLNKADAAALATMAEGRIGAAIRLLDDGGLEAVHAVLNLLTSWPGWDWVRIHQSADTLGRMGQEAAYTSFQDILLWTVQRLTFAKARGLDDAGAPLTAEPLRRMLAHYSLDEWLEICEKLRDHFSQIQIANLDRRQGVLGAFACFH
jgi:DNA polymerase-3 subunit delta'